MDLFENKRLVPGWTQSLSEGFCDLTLIAERDSNIGIWHKQFGVSIQHHLLRCCVRYMFTGVVQVISILRNGQGLTLFTTGALLYAHDVTV